MKKKFLILLTFVFFLPLNVFAEELKLDWQKSWGGNKYDCFDKVLQTKNGDFLVLGGINSTDINGIETKGSSDAILLKYDINGNLIWQKNWGGNEQDSFDNIIETKDGNFIAVGYSYSSNIEELPNKHPANPDIVIVKFDQNGNILWQRGWGGNNWDWIQNVFETEDGDYIIVGYFESTDVSGLVNNGKSDVMLLKYDKDGNLLWQKGFGGSDNDLVQDAYQMKDGSIILKGWFDSTDIEGMHNNGENDVMLLKYDKDGNLLWQKSWGGNGNEQIYEIIQMDNGYFAAIGYFTSTDIEGLNNNGDEDAVILKYDKDGNLIWKTGWGGNGRDYIQNIIQTIDGGFVIFGDVWSVNFFDVSGDEPPSYGAMAKFDKDGNMMWEEIIMGNGKSSIMNVFETNDKNLLIYGSFSSTDIDGLKNNGDTDAMILKYDQNGNLLWQKSWGGNKSDSFINIIETDNNNFLAFGDYWSDNITGLKNNGEQEINILKYDNHGNLLWQNSFGGNKQEYFDDIIYINENSFILFVSTYSTDIEGITNNGESNKNVITKYLIEYNLEKRSIVNGDVILEQRGNKGIVSPLPNKGFVVDNIIVKNSKDEVIEITKLEDGTYSFELSDDVSIEVIFKEELVNPKTGAVDVISTLLVGFIISFIGYTLTKKKCDNYGI